MKNSRTCPKCNGRHLLHLTEVADRDGPRTSFSARTIEGENEPDRYAPAPNVPWRIARMTTLRNAQSRAPEGSVRTTPQQDHELWEDVVSKTAAIGMVEAFICRACGYTEFYTRGVKSIPIDGKLVREIKPSDVEGPYR